jgi:hypothetical protein
MASRIRTRPISFGVVLLALLTAGEVRAQAPPATSPVATPAPAARWKAVFDLLFSGASGNQDLVVLTTGARLTHLEKERFEMEASVQARYGESGGQEVARNLRGGLKLDLNPKAQWSPFVFGTLEHDPFRRLNVRANGGLGVKYSLIDTPEAHLSVSGAGLYSYEDVELSMNSAVDHFRQKARSSWRARGTRTFGNGLRAEQVTFYQPRVTDAADYLLSAESSARAKLSSVVSFKLMHAYERNSTPPENVRRDDHRFEAGLSFQF